MKVKLQTECGCERWIEMKDDHIGEQVVIFIGIGSVANRVFKLAERKADHVVYREADNLLFSPSEMKKRPRVTDDNSVNI